MKPRKCSNLIAAVTFIASSYCASAMAHHEPPLLMLAANETPTDNTAAPAAPPAAVPVKAVPSINPLSGNEEAIKVGARIYFTWCVQCHGQKANGESRFGAYAGNLTKFWRGYREFIKIVQNGRTGNLGMMPAWKDYMDEETIAKIGAFLETLAVDGANWQ